MQLTAADMTEIKKFNRNVEWLKMRELKEKPEAWGSYEEAAKILDRSKEWYKEARNGRINKFQTWVPAKLEKGKDWRMIGNRVEYKLSSIHTLKEKLSK